MNGPMSLPVINWTAPPADAPRAPFLRLSTLWIQITGTWCNLECVHCINASGPADPWLKPIHPDVARRAIREAEDLGVKEIYFTGGEPFLQIWDLSDGTHARMDKRVAVPIEAFPGVMGTALDEAGGHSTMPPRKNGGNMDIKQLTKGSTLYLPVWVDGALFSVGDGHGAQGDGEVCVTAVEMRAQVTLRFGLQPGRCLPEPQLRTTRPLATGTNTAPWYATTAHGPDLFAAAQQAVRHMIDHLGTERGFSREEAYIICSVAADLKISEIVDAPNWIVSAFLPETVFA